MFDVRIDDKNAIFIDDEPLPPSQRLSDALKQRFSAQKNELLLTADDAALHDTVVAVIDAAEGIFPQWVATGSHRLRADEPATVGGSDSGPAPYDFLLAALGACTNMTLKMYAERKGWQIDRLETRLRHDRVHAEDCADCETKEGMVDRIERRITIEGPLDADQRARLAGIADKCPVHRTLHNEITVVTEIDGED